MDMSWRIIRWCSGAMGALVLVGIVSGQALAQKGEVVIVTYGGTAADALREAHWKPFTAETGIVVREETPPTPAKVKAMVETGNVVWDIVEMDLNWIISLQKAGNYLEKIPVNQLPPKYVAALDREAIHEYGIGAFYWAWVLAYRTDVFKAGNRPKSWADFWDVKRFPGPRTLQDSPGSNVEFALLAAGKKPAGLYPLDPDLAFKKLDEIRPSIKKYWDTGALAPQLLADKEVFLGSVYSGRIKHLQDQGIPVEIEWNEGLLNLDYWTIVKGAKNFNNAIKLIGYMLDPARQAKFAKLIPYGPVNKEALPLISPEVARQLPSYAENKKRMILYDSEWWGPRRDELNERWQQWKLKTK
jgi:putative spermidine/putrescine transport system substrate-binding protein